MPSEVFKYSFGGILFYIGLSIVFINNLIEILFCHIIFTFVWNRNENGSNHANTKTDKE